MKRIFSPLFLILLALCAFTALIRPYLKNGVPYTHDGENHLARFANYKVALKEGQWPPRFAPNLMNHYGYPVFNYNYPLANILSLPFSFLRIHYETTFKLIMATGLLVGAGGIFRWLTLSGVSKNWGWLAIAAYFSAPFTANLIFVRGNPGEVWAMALFPWLLWFTQSIGQRKTPSWFVRALIITAFLLSHNIAVLFGGILWGFYTLAEFRKKVPLWKTWLASLAVSVLLALWFWLPALAEKHWVVLDSTALNTSPAAHVATIPQLLFSPIQFGYSYLTPVDTMSFSIGLVSIISFIFCTGWLLKYFFKKNSKESSSLWFFMLVCWVLVLFQLPMSHIVWETVPLVRFIQFPWRLTAFIVIMSMPLIAAAARTHRVIQQLLICALFFQIIVAWRLQPVDILHKTPLDYDLFSQSSTTAHENTPKTFEYETISDWSPEPRILDGEGEFMVEHWAGSSRQYTVRANTTLLIAEPTMYFPGWETLVNGTIVSYTNNEQVAGRIAYALAPGEYHVTTRFTQRTWPRLIGNAVSVTAALVWGWLVWQEKQQKSGKSAHS